MSSREMACCPSSAGSSESWVSGRGGSGTSPSEQPRLQKFFKKHLASKGRCVATVAVSVSDRWLNDGWSCDGL